MASEEGDTSLLFRLPEELLELVVEQAPAESVPALLQTCRRLARIARKRLYAEIAYGGSDRPYDKLVALMDTQPHLRELVKCLSIARVWPRFSWHSPDSRPYPGTARILAHFPSLKTLCIMGALPDRLTEIFASPPDHLLPPLEHIAINFPAPDRSVPGWRHTVRDHSWSKVLSRFPHLGVLSLHESANSGRPIADEEERFRMPEFPKGLHTLTMEFLMVPTDGAAAFADLPALTTLTLQNSEWMISRWLRLAPSGLTHVALHLENFSETEKFSQQLGRFPRLRSLRLSGFLVLDDQLLDFLRASSLRHLELQYIDVEIFSGHLGPVLSLLHGANRMRHLQSIHLGVDSCRFLDPDADLRAVFEQNIKAPGGADSRSVEKILRSLSTHLFNGIGRPEARRSCSLERRRRRRFRSPVHALGGALCETRRVLLCRGRALNGRLYDPGAGIRQGGRDRGHPAATPASNGATLRGRRLGGHSHRRSYREPEITKCPEQISLSEGRIEARVGRDRTLTGACEPLLRASCPRAEHGPRLRLPSHCADEARRAFARAKKLPRPGDVLADRLGMLMVVALAATSTPRLVRESSKGQRLERSNSSLLLARGLLELLLSSFVSPAFLRSGIVTPPSGAETCARSPTLTAQLTPPATDRLYSTPCRPPPVDLLCQRTHLSLCPPFA